MHLKDSEECLQNPPKQNKNTTMTTPRQGQAEFHPLRITMCICLCTQDVSAEQGSSSLGWHRTLPFFRKKSAAVRDGSGEEEDPGQSKAQQSCLQRAQGLLWLLSLCHCRTSMLNSVACKVKPSQSLTARSLLYTNENIHQKKMLRERELKRSTTKRGLLHLRWTWAYGTNGWQDSAWSPFETSPSLV